MRMVVLCKFKLGSSWEEPASYLTEQHSLDEVSSMMELQSIVHYLWSTDSHVILHSTGAIFRTIQCTRQFFRSVMTGVSASRLIQPPPSHHDNHHPTHRCRTNQVFSSYLACLHPPTAYNCFPRAPRPNPQSQICAVRPEREARTAPSGPPLFPFFPFFPFSPLPGRLLSPHCPCPTLYDVNPDPDPLIPGLHHLTSSSFSPVACKSGWSLFWSKLHLLLLARSLLPPPPPKFVHPALFLQPPHVCTGLRDAAPTIQFFLDYSSIPPNSNIFISLWAYCVYLEKISRITLHPVEPFYWSDLRRLYCRISGTGKKENGPWYTDEICCLPRGVLLICAHLSRLFPCSLRMRGIWGQSN